MCSATNYSFIIPHKNIPHLLKRCLSSIPFREDVQIIIVDDNSSVDILDIKTFPALENPCVEVYFTNVGKGAGYARNVGMKHAKGKWLLFADADDFYHEGFLNVLDAYCESDNDIVYFSADSVDSKTLQKTSRCDALADMVKSYLKGDPSSEAQIRYSFWVPWNKMFRRTFIELSHLCFEEIISGNDALFVVSAGYLANKIEVNSSSLYCATYRQDSVTFYPNRNIRRCSFLMRLRLNTFFKTITQKNMRVYLYGDVYDAFQNYGFFESLWYIVQIIRKKQFLFFINKIFARVIRK